MKAKTHYEGHKTTRMPATRLLSAVFQRTIKEYKVKRIVDNFNSNKVRPIVVSYRDGKYHIVDGQHTLTALRRKFGDDVMVDVIILEGLTYEDEATLFYSQYDNCSKLSAVELLKGRVEAKEKIACEMCDVAANAGYVVNLDGATYSGYNRIIAVKQLEKMYTTLGRGDTYRALKLIRDTWGSNPHAVEGNMLKGMTLFYKTYKDKFNEKVFIKQLRKHTPEEIMANAKKRVLNSKDALYAYEICYHYNKGRSRGRLPDANDIR